MIPEDAYSPETPAELRRAEQLLGHIRDRYAQLQKVHAAMEDPHLTSRLAIADRMSPTEPASYLARSFFTVAMDTLDTTLRHIEVTGSVPLVGLFPMIRSSVEASAHGLWLLGKGTARTLAWNSLRIAYANNEQLTDLGRLLAGPEAEKHGQNRLRQKLLDQQQNIKSYKNNDITRFPHTRAIISESDKGVARSGFFSGVQVWKACSGIAHANHAVTRALAERLPDAQAGRSNYIELRARLLYVAEFLIVATENLEHLDTAYQKHSSPQGKAAADSGAAR